MNLQEETIKSCEEEVVDSTSRSPPVDVVKKGIKRAFPPRLQRALRSTFSVDKKRLVKQEWRPRKSAQPAEYMSSDAGASHSPPPASDDDFSHPSKTTVMIKNIPNQLRYAVVFAFPF